MSLAELEYIERNEAILQPYYTIISAEIKHLLLLPNIV
jgi:hypothetical protein